jgi:hypothetical protein
VGNQGQGWLLISWIDKESPYATEVTYYPNTSTNTGVVVTLKVNEEINQPAGRNGAATGTIFTKTYQTNTTGMVTFYDLAENQGSTGILIDWIDTTLPTCAVSYTTTEMTNQPVTVSLT